MFNPELAQQVILDVLDTEVKSLEDGDTITLFYSDLLENYPAVFNKSTEEDLIEVLGKIREISEGLFKPTLKVAFKDRPEKLARVHKGKDVSNLCWEIKYSKEEISLNVGKNKKTILHLKDSVMFSPLNKDCTFDFTQNTVATHLLHFFAGYDSNEFASAEYIKKEIHPKKKTTKENINREISKIRLKMENVFGISGSDFIESNQQGYRLGKSFKIQEK